MQVHVHALFQLRNNGSSILSKSEIIQQSLYKMSTMNTVHSIVILICLMLRETVNYKIEFIYKLRT